jgi:hypothetical protein
MKARDFSLFEDVNKDFPHEADLDFTTTTILFSRFRYHQQLHNIKFTGESTGLDVLVSESFSGNISPKKSGLPQDRRLQRIE